MGIDNISMLSTYGAASATQHTESSAEAEPDGDADDAAATAKQPKAIPNVPDYMGTRFDILV